MSPREVDETPFLDLLALMVGIDARMEQRKSGGMF